MFEARKFTEHGTRLLDRLAQRLPLIGFALVVGLQRQDIEEQDEAEARGQDEQHKTLAQMPAQGPAEKFYSWETHENDRWRLQSATVTAAG